MRRIKYIKSKKFFAKEYKDGIIVAFKNIGDNNSSYADQIHQMVSKNFGVDLFVSDIIESISGTNSYVDSIKASLYIYVKNDVSISASGISLCPIKDCIEVKYNSENVLIVQEKQSKQLWFVCILILLCICGYNMIFNDDATIDEPNIEIQEETANEPSATIEATIPNNHKKNESEQEDKTIENTAEVVETKVAHDEKVLQEVAIPPKVPNDFILIPSGILKKYENEDFALDEFYICKHEVTQKEYMQVMDSNPSSHKGEKLPVCCINLIDAINYCNKRSINEGYDGFYIIKDNIVSFNSQGNGYRLPNRYEWAYAARGAKNKKTKYAAGNNIKEIAWYGGNSNEKPHEVGTKTPNSLGIFDLNGNVEEYLWEKDFSNMNCIIGRDYEKFIGFKEDDVWGKMNCRTCGIRLVFIPKGHINNNIDNNIKVKCWSHESSIIWNIGEYVDGLAVANKPMRDGGYGYMNKNEEFVTPRIYDYAAKFSHGRGLVRLKGKSGFYDSSGNLIISLQYDDASSFSEDLACVSKNGKYGFIDVDNNTIIPFVYDYAYSFSEGLAYACKDGKAGFINKEGKPIIPFIYDTLARNPRFKNGKVEIIHNDFWIEIDKQGKIIRKTAPYRPIKIVD